MTGGIGFILLMLGLLYWINMVSEVYEKWDSKRSRRSIRKSKRRYKKGQPL